jgi:hypothetical protein
MDLDRGARALALRRAAVRVGGVAQLRKYLKVSTLCLAAWMAGADTAPTYAFLKAVDLIAEEPSDKPD